MQYRREDPERAMQPAPTGEDMSQPSTKKVKYGKTGAPGSQKRKDWLNSIRAKKRVTKGKQKVTKEKVEEAVKIIEEVPVELEEERAEVDRPEPPPIKEKLKEKGPPIERDYVDYPY